MIPRDPRIESEAVLSHPAGNNQSNLGFSIVAFYLILKDDPLIFFRRESPSVGIR